MCQIKCQHWNSYTAGWIWSYFKGTCSVQFSRSVVSNFATPWIAARQASLSITNSWSPPKPTSIESVMPSNHLILCHPLLLLLPSIFPSIRVFSSESALLMRWPKYWGFSFTVSPSSEHPGPISFSNKWCPQQCELPLWFLLTWCSTVTVSTSSSLTHLMAFEILWFFCSLMFCVSS